MILACLAAASAGVFMGGLARGQELAPTVGATSGSPPNSAPPAGASLGLRSQQLCQRLRSGDVEAAAQLVALGRFDEISEVDIRPACFSAWMSRREPVGVFSSQQLYGIVLENWADHHAALLGNLDLATHLRARAFMQPRASLEPMLLFQLAASYLSWKPTDPARARELFLLGLLMMPERARDEGGLATLCQAVLTAALGQWKEQTQLQSELGSASAHQGDPAWRARVSEVGAVVALHRNPPQVGAALAGYASAAEDAASAQDAVARARDLMGEAQCLQLERSPAGFAREAIPLYAEAASLFARSGLSESQGLADQAEAEAVRPDHDPRGSWDEARRLYQAAAEAFHAAGDAPSHAACLEAAARAATQDNPLRSTDASRRLLREALQAYRELGNDAAAEALSAWFNPSQPSR